MSFGRTSPIRVLIVDDNRLTVENVRRLLDFENDIEVVATAPDGRQGVDKARMYQPDVVLMDINMPDMDGIEACRRIVQISPQSRVMMMSVQSDMAYFKGAMNAGAREFLVKPFDYDELVRVVRRVSEADSTAAQLVAQVASSSGQPASDLPVVPERGVLVAVFAPKGGVGCTTVAANLAIALRGSRKASVVLADGSGSFGDIDAFLDVHPSHRLPEILDRYDPEDLGLIGQMLAEHASGIQLLVGPGRPEEAEYVKPENYLALLDALRDMVDYVVVDLGTLHNGATKPVLDAADRVVAVVTQEIPAIKDMSLFLMMPMARSWLPQKLLVLLNKYQTRWGITDEIIADTIGRTVALTVPADEEQALAAVNRGRPLLFLAPRSPAVRQLLALEQLMPYSKQVAVEQAELIRQRQGSPPPPLVTQQDAVEPEHPPAEEPRKGCARWFPFIDRWKQ